MRRPALRLFTLCSAASLLLCVAVCVLWARSYEYDREWDDIDADHRGDDIQAFNTPLVRVGGRVVTVLISEGVVHVFVSPRWPPQAETGRLAYGWDRVAKYWNDSRAHAEGYLRRTGTGRFSMDAWIVALLALLLPAKWTRELVKGQRRAAKGHCRACGYDLRATPGRCPECGRAAEVAASSAAASPG